ncbi:unnamed protein product [Urochloa humidicola]
MAAGEADAAAAAARCPSPRRLPCLAGPLSAPSSPPHHAQQRRRASLLTTHNDGGVLGGGDGSGQSEAAASAPHPAAPLTALGAAGLLASLTGSGHRQQRPSIWAQGATGSSSPVGCAGPDPATRGLRGPWVVRVAMPGVWGGRRPEHEQDGPPNLSGVRRRPSITCVGRGSNGDDHSRRQVVRARGTAGQLEARGGELRGQ